MSLEKQLNEVYKHLDNALYMCQLQSDQLYLNQETAMNNMDVGYDRRKLEHDTCKRELQAALKKIEDIYNNIE